MPALEMQSAEKLAYHFCSDREESIKVLQSLRGREGDGHGGPQGGGARGLHRKGGHDFGEEENSGSRVGKPVRIASNPQFTGALGAALPAARSGEKP